MKKYRDKLDLDRVQDKYDNNKNMTLREWQAMHCWCASAFWAERFPKYLKENNISLRSRFVRTIWQKLWDEAMEIHLKESEEFRKQGVHPTITMGDRNITYIP